jgi:hypothetical protein
MYYKLKNREMNENLLNTSEKNENILIEKIEESDKFTKYTLNILILGGSLGFLVVGISSYLNYNLIPILNSDKIIFFPQGLTMCFYGLCGTIVGINQLLILHNKIGEGFNEFNKELGIMKIYRKGKKTDINITYSLKDIVCN